MKELTELKNKILIFSTLAFVPIGYHLKASTNSFGLNSITATSIIIFLSVVLISVTSRFISSVLFSWRFFRKAASGKADIEGFWVVSSPVISEENPQTREAISEVRFNSEKLCFEVVNVRVDKNGKAFYSNAGAISIDTSTGFYTNKFTINSDQAIYDGVAYGTAIRSNSKTYNIWEGVSINLFNFSVIRQRAVRLTEDQVKKLKKSYGNNWPIEHLKNIQAPSQD